MRLRIGAIIGMFQELFLSGERKSYIKIEKRYPSNAITGDKRAATGVMAKMNSVIKNTKHLKTIATNMTATKRYLNI